MTIEGLDSGLRSRKWARRGVVAFGTAVAVLFSVSVPAGAATVRHVNQAAANCSDLGPGTEATPHCTIGAGVSRSVAGDTVLVHSGTYAEQVTLTSSGTSTAPITIAEAAGESVTVEGGVNGFKINSKSWIIVRGFTVRDTTGHGINLTKSSNITIEDNNVSGAGPDPTTGAGGRGISLGTTTNSTVRRNVVRNNTDTGIFLGAGSTGNVISGNSTSANARATAGAAGIEVNAASTQITANVTFDNQDSGINVWDGAEGTTVINNVSYRNGDHGIHNKSSNNTKILSNTVAGSGNSGIEVFNSTGVTLANNISVDSGAGSDPNILVDAASAPTLDMDYDLLFQSAGGRIIRYAGTNYSSLATFQTATGKETNGLQADPAFKNAAAGDFTLTAGSPAIDSANSGVTGHPSTDAKGRGRKDDPDTPNTGAGPRLFDDRGAYEFGAK